MNTPLVPTQPAMLSEENSVTGHLVPLETPALRLHAIETEAQYLAVVRAVRAAGERLIRPTHYLERDGAIVGYFSLNRIPLLTGWMSNQHVTQPEAVAMMTLMEDVASVAGLSCLCAPCTPDCRMLPDMQELGYHTAGDGITLHLKAI